VTSWLSQEREDLADEREELGLRDPEEELALAADEEWRGGEKVVRRILRR